MLAELQKLSESENPIDMEKLGFESMDTLLEELARQESSDLDDLLNEEEDIDDTLPAEPRIMRGEVWQIGRHYLMCGDSTNQEDVAKLLNGQKVDLLITDPPYGASYARSIEVYSCRRCAMTP